MTVTVYGASDDTIQVEGDIRGEILWYAADGPAFLGFSNGVVLRIVYSVGGAWRIAPVACARWVLVEQCPENDEDNYSDRALVSGDVTWVVCGSAWAGAKS